MRKNVLHQLFDVRPTTASGEVDVERIEGVIRLATVDLRGKRKVLPLDDEAHPPKAIRPSAALARAAVLPGPSSHGVVKTEILEALAEVNKQDRVSWVGLARAPLKPSLQPERVPESPGKEAAPRVRTFRRREPAHQEKQRAGVSHAGGHNTIKEIAPRRSRILKEPKLSAGHPSQASGTATAEQEPPYLPEDTVSARKKPTPIEGQERIVEGIFSPRAPASSEFLTISSASDQLRTRRLRLKTVLVAIAALAVFGTGAGVFGGIKSQMRSFVQEGGDMFAGLEEGLASFEKGDWKKALRAFEQAKKSFGALGDELENSGVASAAFAKGEEKVNAGRSFISIGREASEIGSLLAHAAQLMTDPDIFKGMIAIDAGVHGISPHAELFDNIETAEEYLAQAADHFDTLKTSVAGIDPAAVPAEYQEKFFLLADKLPELETQLREGRTLLPLLKHALGEDVPRQYLILLENSSELRATGGFPGTYGLAEFHAGRLTKFFFDGIYNPDGQLGIRVAPPKALQRVSPFWGMRDAGWFFHFPASAKKFAWFYEQAGGPRVDGVIAVTPQFVERLLALTGAFSMPEYGQNVINERNFIEVLQFEVEDDFDPQLGNPKKILTDLTPKVFERLAGFHGEQWESLFHAFETSLHEKDIQLFSFDEGLQEFVEGKEWGGTMAEAFPGSDYLAVVHTNVAGGKADWVTDDELLQEISIAEDGTVMKTVSVTRRHKGGKTPYAWWNAENKDYMRLLVPRGAALLAADGFSERDTFSRTPRDKSVVKDPDIIALESGSKYDPRYRVETFQERDRDAIAGWLMIPPGESRAATFRYRLPERFDPANRFVVHVQKQAGLKPYPVTTRIFFPTNWSVDHQPEGATLRPGFLEIKQPFLQDLHYDIGFTHS